MSIGPIESLCISLSKLSTSLFLTENHPSLNMGSPTISIVFVSLINYHLQHREWCPSSQLARIHIQPNSIQPSQHRYGLVRLPLCLLRWWLLRFTMSKHCTTPHFPTWECSLTGKPALPNQFSTWSPTTSFFPLCHPSSILPMIHYISSKT